MHRAAEIREFAELFKERLDPLFVEQALDYLNFNEQALAFEFLCDHLLEHDVQLSIAECAAAEALLAAMGSKRFSRAQLRALVK